MTRALAVGVARTQAQCAPSCARYRSPFSPENQTGLERPFCAAFPDGIPDVIWNNQADHRLPFEGDHGLQWQQRDGYDFPTSAFAPGILGEVTNVLTAAADVTNGAMIALVPTAEDAARLAVEGGEAAEHLHVTLMYLGDAAAIPAPIADALRSWADGFGNGGAGWSTFEALASGVAALGDFSGEPAIALLLEGADLAEMAETVRADVTEWLEPPKDEHVPWLAHLTLQYTTPDGAAALMSDMGPHGLVAKAGPVNFDRLRVAIGGVVHDVPLGATWAPAPVEDPTPEPEPVVAAVINSAALGDVLAAAAGAEARQQQREVFDGCLRCYGPAHDGACPPAL